MPTTYPRELTRWEEVFDLQGTDAQRELTARSLDRFAFPWPVLLPGLRARVNRTRIPVRWMDCQVYAAAAAGVEVDDHAAPAEGGHADSEHHGHEHGHGTYGHGTYGHEHQHVVVPGMGEAHPIEREIEGRRRILGLAGYGGWVGLDFSLEGDPELTAEVFGSEGAHMADFFHMHYQPDLYRQVWNALHPGDAEDSAGPVPEEGPVGHGHGWFDAGGYYSWAGEAFMGLFVQAFSDVPVTIRFDHPPTAEGIELLRAVYPLPEPAAPEEPTTPEADPALRVYALPSGTIYHETGKHPATLSRAEARGLTLRWWDTGQQATAAGLRPCRSCRPAPLS